MSFTRHFNSNRIFILKIYVRFRFPVAYQLKKATPFHTDIRQGTPFFTGKGEEGGGGRGLLSRQPRLYRSVGYKRTALVHRAKGFTHMNSCGLYYVACIVNGDHGICSKL